MSSEHSCFRCGTPYSLNSSNKIGFRESCAKCTTDLHCCKNCGFYDPKSYNECRETSADRVVDKEKGNRCDYFSVSSKGPGKISEKESAKKKLDDLFK